MLKPVQKSAEIEEVQKEERAFTVVASDETVDRYGDIVRASGWDLKAFKNNPIALFGHDHRSPIGTVPEVEVKNKQLLAKMVLAPEGTDPFIDKLWRLIEANVLRAVSVGFMPTVQPKMIRDEENDRIIGFDYDGQELLELSLVTVPANPAALAVARSLSFDDASTRRIFDFGDRLRKAKLMNCELNLAVAESPHAQ